MSATENGHKGQSAPLTRNEHRRRILAYLQARWQHTSVRELALEIGVSKSALHDLVREVPKDYYAVWPKVAKWYLEDRVKREGALREDEIDDFAMVALQVLNTIPEAEQADALRQYVDFLVRLHDQKLAPYPAWLVQLRAAVAPGREGEGGPPGAPSGGG